VHADEKHIAKSTGALLQLFLC